LISQEIRMTLSLPDGESTMQVSIYNKLSWEVSYTCLQTASRLEIMYVCMYVCTKLPALISYFLVYIVQ
jgi:hypothetical protein